MKRFLTAIQARIVDAKPGEIRALWLGFAFHFLILSGYYITKPIRDSIGASNMEALPWMFTATLIAMLVANAAFAATVARMSRRTFIPVVYGFFIFVFALFFFAMRSRPAPEQLWIGRGFFVWVSVFNLFNTAVFWAFMTDLFTVEQGKRLYGFIAVGGTLGAILGAYITKHYVRDIGSANLLVVAAAMFAIAGFLVRFFPHGFTEKHKTAASATREEPIGGSVWSGITHICHSPYLMGLAASIVLYTTTSTWAYYQQSELAGGVLKSSNARTEFFGNLEIWVNSLTLLIQIFLTGRLLKWFGVAFTLVALPLVSMVGFGAMGLAASLALLAVFQIARRAAAYALMRPSREILFTVLKREDKYKVKSVTDTIGYRTGDQLGSWSYHGLQSLGLNLNTISWIAVPITAGWCVLSLWLGRRQVALAHAREKLDAPDPTALRS
jgi:AAA family ATP:ADP antiporter